MDKAQKAYKEVFNILNKHKEICMFDIQDLKRKSNIHLFAIELKEKYNLNIDVDRVNSPDYINFNEYIKIGWWGKKHRRTISWSDDGKQPDDELLCVLCFSTGAYIFGEDHPKDLFMEFWEELLKYKPKYKDTTNNNLYFSIETSANIFNDFPEILNRFREKNNKDAKKEK